MRSGSVEVVYIGIEDALELPLMQDQQVIEALTPDTAEEALTDSIGTRGVIRISSISILLVCATRAKVTPNLLS